MSENQHWLSRLKRVECRDASFASTTFPLVFHRSGGSIIIDTDGRQYTDLCAGFGVHAFGHYPSFLRKIWHQAAEEEYPEVMHGMGDVYASKAKVELIESLLDLLPKHFSKVSLALSGSQAIEVAMKTAMMAKTKNGFFCFEHAYHGLDLGSLHLTYRDDFRRPFENFMNAQHVRFLPNFLHPADQKKALDQALSDMRPAAVVVETVQGRAGVIPRSEEWLLMLRAWCDEHDVVLIYDEIFTGLGRTGCMSYAEIVPSDISCFGKALGGGLPLSACVGREELMSAWPENHGEAIHTGTFFGHPLSCRLGVEVIRELKSQRIDERALSLGAEAIDYLRSKLKNNIIRGQGLMIGIEYAESGRAALMMEQLLSLGVIALPSGADGRCLSITPALNIDRDLFFEALDKIIQLSLPV